MAVTMELPLPFELPFAAGISLVSSYELADFKATFVRHDGVMKRVDVPDEPYPYTTIHLTLDPKGALRLVGDDYQTFLYNVVTMSLRYVNRVVDATRAAYNVGGIRNLTIVDLPSAIVVHINDAPYLYVKNLQGILPATPELGADALAVVGKTMAQWKRYPEIGITEQFFVSAKTALAREQFSYAVIELQTSFEVFIRNSHKFILLKRGMSESDIAKAMRIQFRQVIEIHLEKLLQVNLSFTSPGVIKDWNDKLYSLRNEIVHSGRSQVSAADAYSAFDAYAAARGFLAERMAEQGFLTSEGRIDLNVFRPSNISPEVDGTIFAQLQREGLLPPEAKYEDIERR